MIHNFFKDQHFYIPVLSCRHAEAACTETEPFLAKEQVLTLYAGERQVQRFLCSPAQLAELCLGWLCDEGYIKTAEEVTDLWIAEDGCTAKVSLKAFQKREVAAFPAFAALDEDLRKKAAGILLDGDTIYSKTRGTHGCVYVSGDGTELFCEDIGRNNAMDKVIGSLLLQGKNPAQGLLFSSGRVTADIVKKVVQAGIPVLVTKATVTADAVEAAKQYRLRLAFFANHEHYVLAE